MYYHWHYGDDTMTKLATKQMKQTELSYQKEDVFIVIAAYNESKSISLVIERLTKAGYTNIVVTDDGSKDTTYDIIANLPVYALRHRVNRGQGAALKTGIDFALLKDAKYIVTFDADGQHRVEDLEAMITPVAKGNCEITLGSRFLKKSVKLPFAVLLRLKIGIIVQYLFYGLLLTDAHNGFRCFSRIAAQRIKIRSNRMEHASEIVEEIKKKDIRYKEVPVIIIYTKEIMQKGHGSFFGGIKILIKMILHKLMG